MTDKKSEEYQIKATIVMALASFVIATVAVASARTNLPLLFVYGSLVILFVALIVFVWPFSIRPAFNFLKTELEIRKHNRLAKKYFNEFKGFVNDFENFCGSENPVGALIKNLIHDDNNLTRKEFSEHLSNDYNEDLRAEYLPGTFNLFKTRVNKFNGTKEDFLLLVAKFENLLDIYKALFINKLLKAVKEVGRDKLYADYREEYNNNFRADYNDFIKNYTLYGRKVNGEFEEKIIKIKFEMVKEL